MACIFVGQLPFSKFFDADVYDLLEPYGRVLSVRMQHVKGEAFVYFDSVSSADAAIAALHGRRTLKGRQRPLQLFYASSSAEWSWFGIMHNTRLHHINHKVELPPFFVKTPPLAGSQWSLVPHITDEATELVLPATQQAMLAAEDAELRSGEAKSTSSSLRTTTSSSSLYSDDSSADSARRPSRRRGSSASVPTTPSRSNVVGGAAGGVALRAGTKRPRLQLPSGEEEEEDEEARAAAQRVPTSAANEEQSAERTHTQRTRSRRHGSGDEEEACHRSRKTRSHRKTKLRIEDEENFAVLGDEEAEEEEAEAKCIGSALRPHCTEATTTATTATRAVVGARSSPASSSLVSSTPRTMLSGLAEEPPRATGSGGGGGGGGTVQDAFASRATAAAAPASSRRQPLTFLRAADAPFAELPSVLEHSVTTTNTTNTTTASTLSTTLSSAEDADVVGARSVLIRRRRSARRAGTRLDGPNTAPAAASSSAPAASASRPGWGGMLPHHYHHATHSSSTSLSPTPTDAITPNSSLTNVSPPATAAVHVTAALELHPSLAASPLSDQPPRRLSRVASPYHHHHHHHLRGAVLSNADLRDVRRSASRRAVLGALEDAPRTEQQQQQQSRGGSWTEVNEPVLASPPQQQQPVQRGECSSAAASIFPLEPPQLGDSRTWAGGSGGKKNSAPAESSRGSGRGRDGHTEW